MQGRVKTHRKILDSFPGKSLELLGMISFFLLSASHEKKSFYLGMTKIDLKPGEFVSSMQKIADRFSISKSKAYRIVVILEDEGFLKRKKNAKYTLFTVINRKKYQVMKQKGNDSDTPNETKVVHNQEGKEIKEIYIALFKTWNKQKITAHREITVGMENKILKRLEDFKFSEIKKSIENFGEIYSSQETRRTYKRTFEEFLKRDNGMKVFLHKSKEDYLKKKISSYSPTDGKVPEADELFKKQELRVQQKLKDRMPSMGYTSEKHLQNHIEAVLKKGK